MEKQEAYNLLKNLIDDMQEYHDIPNKELLECEKALNVLSVDVLPEKNFSNCAIQ